MNPASGPPSDHLEGLAPTLIVRGGLCVLPDRVAPADVAVRGDRIIRVQPPGSPAGDDIRIVDATGCLVTPGFVNTHSHSYGELCRHSGAELPLEPWMNHALAGTLNRATDEIAVSSAVHAIEAVRTGTTTVVDHIGGDIASLIAVTDAYAAVGIRSRIAPMIGDLRLPSTVGIAEWPTTAGADSPMFDTRTARELIAATLALRESVRGGLLTDVLLGPSAPQRVSPEMWQALAEQRAGSDLRVHTHLLETRLQAALPAPGGAGWVAYLDSLGLLDEGFSAAHGVWLGPDDIELLAHRGVTLVHNPQSNLQLGSGIAELTRWRRTGVRVALGTDSVNCGGSMDMLNSMRLAALLHRPGNADPDTWETPASVLRMATEAGARALGIPAGRIEVSALADLAIFEMRGSVWATSQDPIAALVLDSYDHRARSVVIGGAVVLENDQVLGVDEPALLEAVAPARAALRTRNASMLDVAERQQALLVAAAQAAPTPRELLPRDSARPGSARQAPATGLTNDLRVNTVRREGISQGI